MIITRSYDKIFKITLAFKSSKSLNECKNFPNLYFLAGGDDKFNHSLLGHGSITELAMKDAVALFFNVIWDCNIVLGYYIALFLCMHFGISACLLRFPRFYTQERRKRQKRLKTPLKNIRVIGHRGCVPEELDGQEVCMNITENTLGAFSHAISGLSGSPNADCISDTITCRSRVD